jgi:hypothetical protein
MEAPNMFLTAQIPAPDVILRRNASIWVSSLVVLLKTGQSWRIFRVGKSVFRNSKRAKTVPQGTEIVERGTK